MRTRSKKTKSESNPNNEHTDKEKPIKKRRGRPKSQTLGDNPNDSGSQPLDDSTVNQDDLYSTDLNGKENEPNDNESSYEISEQSIIKNELSIQETVTVEQYQSSSFEDGVIIENNDIKKSLPKLCQIDDIIPGEELFEPHFEEDEEINQDQKTIFNGDSHIEPINEPEPVEEGLILSNIIHITNLVRPFTLSQLKEEFLRYGNFEEQDLLIDKIKSHCFIRYPHHEIAKNALDAMSGQHWPSSNPKILKIEFADQEEFDHFKKQVGEVAKSDNRSHSTSSVGSLKVGGKNSSQLDGQQESGELDNMDIVNAGDDLTSLLKGGSTATGTSMEAHEFHLHKNLGPLLPQNVSTTAATGATALPRRIVIKTHENIKEKSDDKHISSEEKKSRKDSKDGGISGSTKTVAESTNNDQVRKRDEGNKTLEKGAKRVLYVNIPGRTGGTQELNFEIEAKTSTTHQPTSKSGGESKPDSADADEKKNKAGQLMDELFKKTTIAPGIYWLPLSLEEANEKYEYLDTNNSSRLYITENDAERAFQHFHDYSNLSLLKPKTSIVGGTSYPGRNFVGGRPMGRYDGGRVNNVPYRRGLSPQPLMNMPLLPVEILDEAAAIIDDYRAVKMRNAQVGAGTRPPPLDDYYPRDLNRRREEPHTGYYNKRIYEEPTHLQPQHHMNPPTSSRMELEYRERMAATHYDPPQEYREREYYNGAGNIQPRGNLQPHHRAIDYPPPQQQPPPPDPRSQEYRGAARRSRSYDYHDSSRNAVGGPFPPAPSRYRKDEPPRRDYDNKGTTRPSIPFKRRRLSPAPPPMTNKPPPPRGRINSSYSRRNEGVRGDRRRSRTPPPIRRR